MRGISDFVIGYNRIKKKSEVIERGLRKGESAWAKSIIEELLRGLRKSLEMNLDCWLLQKSVLILLGGQFAPRLLRPA